MDESKRFAEIRLEIEKDKRVELKRNILGFGYRIGNVEIDMNCESKRIIVCIDGFKASLQINAYTGFFIDDRVMHIWNDGVNEEVKANEILVRLKKQ